MFILNDLKSLHDSFLVAESSTKYDRQAIAEITRKISDLRNKITTA
jgi:hypothetical protein